MKFGRAAATRSTLIMLVPRRDRRGHHFLEHVQHLQRKTVAVEFRLGKSSARGAHVSANRGIMHQPCYGFHKSLRAFWRVTIPARHPEVSPWFPMLLLVYPIFETLFSIYRRKFVQGQSPGQPDRMHLHQVICMRLTRARSDTSDSALMTRLNSMAAPYGWLITLFCAVPAGPFRTFIRLSTRCRDKINRDHARAPFNAASRGGSAALRPSEELWDLRQVLLRERPPPTESVSA